MKLIDASMAIVLMTMAAACSDNEPKPDVTPAPIDGGAGSEPTPLTPDPAPDGAVKQP